MLFLLYVSILCRFISDYDFWHFCFPSRYDFEIFDSQIYKMYNARFRYFQLSIFKCSVTNNNAMFSTCKLLCFWCTFHRFSMYNIDISIIMFSFAMERHSQEKVFFRKTNLNWKQRCKRKHFHDLKTTFVFNIADVLHKSCYFYRIGKILDTSTGRARIPYKMKGQKIKLHICQWIQV